MLGELASGIAGMAGSIWSTHKNNKLQYKMFQEANAFNSAEAEKQRNWEADMANTAHQREVADLQNAGLNPVLSAGGNGATTPSGSSASSAGTPSTMPLLNDPMAFANLMNQTSLITAQKQNIDADTDLKNRTSGKTEQETALLRQKRDLDNQLAQAQVKLQSAQEQLLQAQTSTEKRNAYKVVVETNKEVQETRKKMQETENLLQQYNINENGTFEKQIGVPGGFLYSKQKGYYKTKNKYGD